MSVWKALVGRITLFPGSPPSVPLPSALDLYQQVWRGNPDNFQSSLKALTPTVANGKRGGLTVGCSVHPMRIDFNLTPLPATSDDEVISFILIEDISQLKDELTRLIEFVGGFAVINSVSRVGLYLHFLTLVPSIKEANRVLVGVMPDQYRAQITDEEDFIFQINRPRMSSGVADVKINYLTKWNVDRFKVFNVAIAMNAPVVDSRTIPSQQGQDFIAASVVFDFNNVPVSVPLSGEQQSLLLIECLTTVKEMQRDFGLNIEGF